MAAKNLHIGSSLDDFLKEEGILEEVTAKAIKRVLAWQINQIMKQKKLTKTRMAKQMKTSRAQLDRLLDPNNQAVTLLTITRAAQTLGKRVEIQLVDA